MGVLVVAHSLAVGTDRDAVLAEDFGDVLPQVEAVQERVAHLDVNVDVGQGFQLCVVALLGVVGVFQQLYPQAEAADIDGVGIEVHAKQAVFDDFALLVEEGFLYALTLLVARYVAYRIAILVGHKEFIVFNINAIVLFLDALAGAVDEDAEVIFGADNFIEN